MTSYKYLTGINKNRQTHLNCYKKVVHLSYITHFCSLGLNKCLSLLLEKASVQNKWEIMNIWTFVWRFLSQYLQRDSCFMFKLQIYKRTVNCIILIILIRLYKEPIKLHLQRKMSDKGLESYLMLEVFS